MTALTGAHGVRGVRLVPLNNPTGGTLISRLWDGIVAKSGL